MICSNAVAKPLLLYHIEVIFSFAKAFLSTPGKTRGFVKLKQSKKPVNAELSDFSREKVH